MSPRTKEQNKMIKEEKRKAILLSALKLFSQKSFYDAKMSEVAQEAGVSKGSIYNYFESKESILIELVNWGFDTINGEFAAIPVENRSAKDLLKSVFDYMISIMENQEHYFFQFGMLINRAEVLAFCGDLILKQFSNLISYFREVIKNMGSQYPEEDSLIIGAILDGMFYHAILIGDKYPFSEVKKRLYDFYFERLEKMFTEEKSIH